VQKGEASYAMFTSSVEDEYDFIVVGSGAGGGPVAVNLAKAGYATRGFAELVAFNADSISTF
jgi:succinate dehydrogenase/fumarate reductase flavoprotein subunit